MNRYQTYRAINCFLALVVFAHIANAQSKDRDNPTNLASGEILGLINSDSIGNAFYYSFTTNRGEVSITLTVEPGKQVNYGDFTLSTVSFRLFNGKGKVVLDNGVATGTGESKYYTAKAEVTQRQTMVLRIDIPSGRSNNAVGAKYRIQIGGAVKLPQSISTTGDPLLDKALSTPLKGCLPEAGSSLGTLIYSKCFPKQGTLVIEMKDGSKRVIDLSDAEVIKFVP